MPRLVLLAKNTYVWLGQLSKNIRATSRPSIRFLMKNLALLASRGFAGLWLIGLWERNRASQRIKQRMGQDDAVASAYSLDSYDIADDLGGWDALNNLRSRAWSRGKNLSADMVPIIWGLIPLGSRIIGFGFVFPIFTILLIHSALKIFRMIHVLEFT